MELQNVLNIAIKISMILPLAYVAFCLLFYLFLKNLLRNPADRLPVIYTHSWHFKLAYPFKKNKHYQLNQSIGYYLETNLLGYLTKMFFMITLGWPTLIIWQTAKMIIYTPVLFLFGFYPKPSLKEMSDDENPFAVKIYEFYVPTLLINDAEVRLYPILLLLIAALGLITYIWPVMVLLIVTGVFIVVASVFLIIYLTNVGLFKLIKRTLIFISAKPIGIINKYNHEIIVKDCSIQERRTDE